jgi:hypothetical protein
LKRAKIDINNITPDASNNFIISNPVDKLNVIDAHFANVHKLNENIGSEGLKNRITHETNKSIDN